MIFTEIVIHNFGIYKGRHIVAISPESTKKPIILFGGLNGGGKTTFLDALQLTLYGKFANCSNRGELPYTEYLKETINKHVQPEDGAALELEFIYFYEGNQTVYRIKRFWKSTGKGIKETMEILKNGVLDPVMSKHWYEYVDEFFPSNISGLFFFDGEQIETLANPESSAKIIRTGIMSLLGLDLVEKLQMDLTSIEKRRLTRHADIDTNNKIKLIQNELAQLQERHVQQGQILANKASKIDSLNLTQLDAKNSYRIHGGELYEQREVIEKQHHHHEQQLRNVGTDIRKYADGAAPLLIVRDLIRRAKKQAKKEQGVQLNRDLIETIIERDSDILVQFAELSDNKQSLELLNQLLTKDRNTRQHSTQGEILLNIPPDALQQFDSAFFSQLKKDSRHLKKSYDLLNAEQAISDQQLSSIPEEAMIKECAQQLKAAEDESKVAQGELNILQENHDETAKGIANKHYELDRLYHRVNEEKLGSQRDKMVLGHTREARHTLGLFRKALTCKHIDHLETLIKESFTTLIRKSDLIHKVRISTEDFTLHVISRKNEVIPTNRLSAGERQLLAISILWGLAKASGCPLPAIIDTPLGRLDSKHRKHLVDNYFGNASHQVILLSTDTEIDRKIRDDLSDKIGKEYHIQYQESEKTSTITPGYF